MDLYLQRVRKYSTTLPDTALSPANASEANNAGVPRMGTPQTDTSWAGWAISSFTNKLGAASGDMQPHTNATISKGAPRSVSVPPTPELGRLSSTTGTASTPLRHGVNPAAAPRLSRVATADFFSSVQDEDDDDAAEVWGDAGEDSFFDAPSETSNVKPAVPAASFDDGGEPDFAGWLAAQAQAKSKKPLPRGLTKTSVAATEGRPVLVSRSATSSAGNGLGSGTQKSRIAASESKAAAVKKIDTKPKERASEADGWDDAWD